MPLQTTSQCGTHGQPLTTLPTAELCHQHQTAYWAGAARAWAGRGWTTPQEHKERLEVLRLLPVPLCRAEASQPGSCPELLEGVLAGHPSVALGTQGPSVPPLRAAGTAQPRSRTGTGPIARAGVKSPAPTQPWPCSLAGQRRRMLSPALARSSPRSAGAQARSCPGVTPQRIPEPARLGLTAAAASAWPLVINARRVCRPGHA